MRKLSLKGLSIKWPMPDFLPRRRRPPPLAWLLGLAGVASLLAALGQGWTQQQQLDELARDQGRWQAELRQLRAARVAATASTPGMPEPSARARAEAHRLDQRLSHRWNEVLQPLEQLQRPGLQWLRLAHDADRGDLLLEGRAPTRDDALQVAAALDGAAGWRGVLLQRVEGALDGPQVRFEVAAHTAAATEGGR